MADGFFDRNLKRLLRVAWRPAEAAPHFRESLRQRLHEEAASLREPGSARVTVDHVERHASRRSQWVVGAAAMLLVSLGGIGLFSIFRDLQQPISAPERIVCVAPPIRQPQPLVLSVDRPVVVEVARGSVGSVNLVRRDVEIAHLDLKDGAALELRPGSVPVLALRDGLLRVEALQDLKVQAGHVELDVGEGAEVEIEFVGRGDRSMNKSWLIPGGIGAAAGAALVAILVHQGKVEVKVPESRPSPLAIEQRLVVEVPTTRPVADDDRDRRLAQAERKITDLEKKLAAAKKESEKLAQDLVQKKGVTLDNIAARLAELRKGTGMNVFLPGKTADLIADLKGLGLAGTQALMDMLKSEDPKDRFIAAKLLEDLKDPASIPALRDVALNDPDAMASNMAGHALALMADPRAADTLREMVSKKRSWESEVNALWGLVNLGDAQGLEQATAYMQDQKISGGARAALGANIALFMHTPDVMPIVDATVRDFHESAQIMEIAIEYYKAVGNADARQRLQAIADDTRLSQEVRNQATQALQH